MGRRRGMVLALQAKHTAPCLWVLEANFLVIALTGRAGGSHIWSTDSSQEDAE